MDFTSQGYHRVHVTHPVAAAPRGIIRPVCFMFSPDDISVKDKSSGADPKQRWLWLASNNYEAKVGNNQREIQEIHVVVYIDSNNVWRRLTVMFTKSERPEGSFEDDLMEDTGGHVMGRSDRIYNTVRRYLDTMRLCNDAIVTRLVLATRDDEKLWCDVSAGRTEIFPEVSSDRVRRLGCRLIPESSMQFLGFVDSDIHREELSERSEDAWSRIKQGEYYVMLQGVVYIKIDFKDRDSVRVFLNETERDQQAGTVVGLAINQGGTHIKGRLVNTDITMAHFSRMRKIVVPSTLSPAEQLQDRIQKRQAEEKSRRDEREQGPDSPDYGLHGNRRDPAQDYLAQSGARPASTPSKALARKPAPGNARQQQSQPYDSQQYRFFSPNEDGSRPPSSSSRGSPTRSLPDEPDWTPRSHSSSSAPLYSADPFDYQTHGPSAQYQHGRRNFSGPAGVSYSALRRVPVPASGAMTRVPTSEPTPMQRSASGLSNEVIEISSDDDSDEGVRVDSQGYSTGYGVVARGGGRVRPGRR